MRTKGKSCPKCKGRNGFIFQSKYGQDIWQCLKEGCCNITYLAIRI